MDNISRRSTNVDLRLRLALGMGMFREIKPVKETTQINSNVPYIIEREDGTMVYVAPQMCIVNTSCRVIVPNHGAYVFVGIDSKAKVEQAKLEELITEVLIPVQLKDKGLAPIRSKREDIPVELLNPN